MTDQRFEQSFFTHWDFRWTITYSGHQPYGISSCGKTYSTDFSWHGIWFAQSCPASSGNRLYLYFQPEISFQRHNSSTPSYLKFGMSENGETPDVP